MNVSDEHRDCYEELRAQIDKMPVGMPKTESGIEIRILKALFTPEEARIALHLNIMGESAAAIHRRVAKAGIDMGFDELETMLDCLAKKGAILGSHDVTPRTYGYALFAVGMYEFQVDRMTASFFKDCENYLGNEFGAEYHRHKFPQIRTVPIAKSVPVEHPVATYDDMRAAIAAKDGRFALLNCLCKQGRDMTGEPCRTTDIRETCLIFPGTAEHYLAFGTGRPIYRDEALAVLERAEAAGLVIQPTNSKDPIAICCCCGDCCGVMMSAKKFPRPAELFASNYYAVVATESCKGSCLCVKRCQMEAINVRGGKAVIDRNRCIGCGLCVTVCPTGSISLAVKERAVVPPRDTQAYYTRLLMKRVGIFKTMRAGVRLKLGMKV